MVVWSLELFSAQDDIANHFIVMDLFLWACGANCSMHAGRLMRDKQLGAKEILDRRYASGDISQEEYQRIKTEIS